MLKRFLIFFLVLALAVPAWAIKYKGDLESNESITFPEQSSKPANPAATKHKLYFKDDGAAYSLDSSGSENPVAATTFKNKIINGNFDIWQRGTSFATPANNSYNADRWRVQYDGTIGTFTVSRQAFTLGQTDVPGEPQYYLRWDHTAAGSGSTLRRLAHRIEGVRTFAGQTMTVSFYLKCDAARTVASLFVQRMGSGGSPSADVTSSSSNHSCTTSWTLFSHTLTLGSLSAKTLGTNDDDNLELIFELPLNVVMTIDVSQVQVEKGSVATGFERRLPGMELALAQRYYQKTFPLATAPAQNAGTDDVVGYRALLAGVNHFIYFWYFQVPMRTDPTLTYYSPLSASANFYNNADSAESGTPATELLSPNYVGIRNPQVAADGVGESIWIHVTADAEL